MIAFQAGYGTHAKPLNFDPCVVSLRDSKLPRSASLKARMSIAEQGRMGNTSSMLGAVPS